MIDYVIVDNLPSDDACWETFSQLVVSERWLSDDKSVLTLVPHLPTTRSVFAKTIDGQFIGAVVWNEYDNLAWLGFYLLTPETRGKGIGSILWKRALERIQSTPKLLGLRGVPLMAPRYKANDTPYERGPLGAFVGPWKSFKNIAEKLLTKVHNTKIFEEPTGELFGRICKFDKLVTGRDRKEFLKKFFELSFTYCCCKFEENEEISALAYFTPTGPENERIFKVGGVYASSLEDAFAVCEPLFVLAGKQFSEAQILMNTTEGVGRAQIEPLLIQEPTIKGRADAMTSLFQEKTQELYRTDMLFAPHNNACHYDA